MSEQNFVPKANNNGQTLGTSARQWTAAYVSSVPDEDSAVVNKAYLDSFDLDNVLTEVNKRQRIMQKVKVTGTTPSIDVQSGKAYSCGTVSSLTINSLPGRDNFEESCILFTGTSSTSITVNSTDWSYVGDMSISSDGDYIISIMNNTLILNKVISGN